MEKQIAELWRMLKPGGRLVVTVWGEQAFEPGGKIFYDELRRLRPGLHIQPPPWTRLTTPEGLRALMAASGAADDPEIVLAADHQPLVLNQVKLSDQSVFIDLRFFDGSPS